jgi:ATP synthase protein I
MQQNTVRHEPARQMQQQQLSQQGEARQVLANQDSVDRVLVLSDADRAALNAQAGRGLLLALVAQGAMGLAAAVIAGVVGGAAAGWSALAGAGAYFIPNALFALRLAVSVRAGKASPFTFLSGELIKLFATALLLWLLSHVAQDTLVWPAALLGLILTLKGYLLLLMFRKLS